MTEPLWVEYAADVTTQRPQTVDRAKSPKDKEKSAINRFAAKAELERLIREENLSFEAAAARLKMSPITVRRWSRTLGCARYGKISRFEMRSLSSQVPYGWESRNGILRRKPDEIKWVSVARQMRDRGSSFHAIARHLNERGVPTKNGGRWHAKTISQILKFNKK